MPNQDRPHKDPITTAANEAPKETKNELIISIEKGDLKKVYQLLNDVDFFKKSYKDSKGNTPLHFVGKIKDDKVRHEIATALIYAGMDISVSNDNDEKPENYEHFQKIKKERKNRFINNFANWILIRPTLSGQRIKVLATLIMQICIAVFIPEYTFIYSAVWLMQLLAGSVVQRMDKATLQKRHEQQVEADFCRAIADNKLNAVKLVYYIEQGVNIHFLKNFNPPLSALAMAASINNLEQVKFLLPYSGTTDVSDILLVSHLLNETTMNYLLSAASKNALNYMLYLSVFQKNYEMVKLLIEKGVEVSAGTALYAAFPDRADLEILKLLQDARKQEKEKLDKASNPELNVETPKVLASHFEAIQKAAGVDTPSAKAQAEEAKSRKETLRSHVG